MGLDVIAFSKAMVANASGDATKGYFIGHSQGTIAAFTAMTRYQSDFEQYIKRAILYAPCFNVPSPNGIGFGFNGVA